MHVWLSAQSEAKGGKVTVVCFQLRTHKRFLLASSDSIGAHLRNEARREKQRNFNKKVFGRQAGTAVSNSTLFCLRVVEDWSRKSPNNLFSRRERSCGLFLGLPWRFSMTVKQISVSSEPPVNLARQLDRSHFNPEISLKHLAIFQRTASSIGLKISLDSSTYQRPFGTKRREGPGREGDRCKLLEKKT